MTTKNWEGTVKGLKLADIVSCVNHSCAALLQQYINESNTCHIQHVSPRRYVARELTQSTSLYMINKYTHTHTHCDTLLHLISTPIWKHRGNIFGFRSRKSTDELKNNEQLNQKSIRQYDAWCITGGIDVSQCHFSSTSIEYISMRLLLVVYVMYTVPATHGSRQQHFFDWIQ